MPTQTSSDLFLDRKSYVTAIPVSNLVHVESELFCLLKSFSIQFLKSSNGVELWLKHGPCIRLFQNMIRFSQTLETDTQDP